MFELFSVRAEGFKEVTGSDSSGEFYDVTKFLLSRLKNRIVETLTSCSSAVEWRFYSDKGHQPGQHEILTVIPNRLDHYLASSCHGFSPTLEMDNHRLKYCHFGEI